MAGADMAGAAVLPNAAGNGSEPFNKALLHLAANGALTSGVLAALLTAGADVTAKRDWVRARGVRAAEAAAGERRWRACVRAWCVGRA